MKKEERIQFLKDNAFSFTLITIAAILITWTGIAFKQNVFRILPLYISLIIGMLQAKANRYANLIGSINCLIYTAVYLGFGLYATAASTLLISCPMQLITFIRWNKRAYKHSTEFRSLNGKQWLILAATFVTSFLVLLAVLTATGSSYRLVDNGYTLVGIFVSILTMLSFREYTWFMIGTGILSVALDLTLMQDYPAQITYLIYSFYSLICIGRQFFSVRKLFAEQKNEAAK